MTEYVWLIVVTAVALQRGAGEIACGSPQAAMRLLMNS